MKLNLFSGLFLLLLFTCLPYPIRVLGRDEGMFYPLISKPLNHLCKLLGVQDFNPNLLSDGKMQYLLLLCIFIIACLAFLLLLKLDINKSKLLSYLRKLNLLILSFFLIRYGFDKLFGGQFDIVEGNLLQQELQFFDKDLLFWVTVQSSSFFNIASGILEIIAGLSILNSFTRKFGILLALLSTSFILLINISFDINVKILSLGLFLQAIYALSPYLKNIKEVLFPSTKMVVLYRDSDVHFMKSWKLSLFILFCISESVIIPIQYNKQEYIWANSYAIEGSTTSFIHLHSDEFLIEQNGNHFSSNKVQIIPKSENQFKIIGKNINSSLILNSDNQSLFITEEDTLKVRIVDFGKSAYLQDDFHLYTENSLK